ncbi:fungal hydrophobin-domain-containing protein [Cladorrhinum sp. PSN259]|nr:fungal hydrophobin-domain-containing protein [Cladorrhinum sp. PSN259]
MKFTISTTIFFAAALQSGLSLADDVCPEGNLYTVPQCCKTDFLGVAASRCRFPTLTAESPEELRDICASTMNSPFCCTVPVAGQGALCIPAIGK